MPDPQFPRLVLVQACGFAARFKGSLESLKKLVATCARQLLVSSKVENPRYGFNAVLCAGQLAVYGETRHLLHLDILKSFLNEGVPSIKAIEKGLKARGAELQ